MMPQKQNCKSGWSAGSNSSCSPPQDSLRFGSRHQHHHRQTLEFGNNGQPAARLPFRNAYSGTSSNLTIVPGFASRNPVVGNPRQNELNHRTCNSMQAQLITGNQVGYSQNFDFVRPGSYVVNPFLEGTTPNANGARITESNPTIQKGAHESSY